MSEFKAGDLVKATKNIEGHTLPGTAGVVVSVKPGRPYPVRVQFDNGADEIVDFDELEAL